MAQPTDNKKPLDLALAKQQAVIASIKTDAALLKIQKVVNAIGATAPSKPTKPAS